MNRHIFWLAIALIAVGTQAMRLVPLLAHGKLETPARLKRLLEHVPAAALAALVIPGSVWLRSEAGYDVSIERIIALALAAVVGFRTKNIIATIVTGLAALWIAQLVL